MARARNIKPGFFKNEKLAELPLAARLLFAGLWTIADRKGRLEDRPKRIKAELFPYENHNISKLLTQLSDAGFIVRYSINSLDFIAIPTWDKHQNPHKKEPASTILAPDQHCARTDFSGTSPADSLNPITDSLNPESGAQPKPEPIVQPKKQPALLDDFGRFMEAAKLAELPASEVDFANAKFEWKRLDFQQKTDAVKGLNERVVAGEYRDVNFRPLPQNYLKNRMWQRPIRASPKPKEQIFSDLPVFQGWEKPID